MTFSAYAAQEMSALAERLTTAAALEVETATSRTASLQATIDTLRADYDKLAGEASELDGRNAELAAAVASLETALSERQERLRSYEQAAAERELALEQAAAARDEEMALRRAIERQLEEMRQLLDRSREDVRRLTAEATDTTEHLIDLPASASARSALVDRLQVAFEHVARSTTVDEVVAATATALRGDFSRVVVFAIRDDRLEPRYQSGFEANSGIGKVVVPLSVESFLTEAASADAVRMREGDGLAAAGLVPFGGSPQMLVTIPIKVRDDLLALIYADDSGRQEPRTHDRDDRMKLADILRRHAVLRLERLTVELKTLAELRAYAKMLLDEVEYVYTADASAGKTDRERQERLFENLRCARQIYEQRVTVEGPSAAMLLEEQIASTVGARSSSPFGRDLALVASGAHAAPDVAGVS